MPRHTSLLVLVLALSAWVAPPARPAGDLEHSKAKVRYGGTYSSPYLITHLATPTTEFMRQRELIHWRSNVPVRRVRLGLETLLHGKHWRKRKAAVGDLLWHPSAQVEDGLIIALRDPVLAVRQEAVRALARIGTNRSLQPLMDAMKFSPGPIRDDIGEALRQLTGESYGRHLDRWRNWYEANRGALR